MSAAARTWSMSLMRRRFWVLGSECWVPGVGRQVPTCGGISAAYGSAVAPHPTPSAQHPAPDTQHPTPDILRLRQKDVRRSFLEFVLGELVPDQIKIGSSLGPTIIVYGAK